MRLKMMVLNVRKNRFSFETKEVILLTGVSWSSLRVFNSVNFSFLKKNQPRPVCPDVEYLLGFKY